MPAQLPRTRFTGTSTTPPALASGSRSLTLEDARAWGWSAVLWLLFAAAHPWAQGVVLDDSVTSSQILRGALDYPAGHPNAIYHREALSLVNAALAGVGSVAPSVEFLAGLMNTLTIFTALFASFALASVLTGSFVWGHLGACLTAAGVAHALEGLYPLWTYPNFNASGQIGLHAGLFSAALLLGRRWSAAGFALGVLPCVHAVLAAVFWIWGALHFASRARADHAPARRKFLSAFALGLLASAAVAAFFATRTIPPADGPYDVASDSGLARDGFLRFLDVHRAPIPWRSSAYLLGPGLFFALVCVLRRSERDTPLEQRRLKVPHGGVLLLGVLVWVFVLGAGAWQSAGQLPDLLLTAMPARFSNITAAMVPPLIAAAIGRSAAIAGSERRVALFAVAATTLASLAALALLRPRLEASVLLPVSVACALACVSLARRGGWKLGACVLAAIVLLGWFASGKREFATAAGASWIAMMLLGAATLRMGARAPFGAEPAITACAAAGLAACTLFVPTQKPGLGWARITAEDRHIERWLSEHSRPEELLLVALTPPSAFQLKTGHPVLFELRTLWEMAYVPRLSAVTGRLALELYGVDLGAAKPSSTPSVILGDGPAAVWSARERPEWERLSERYGFHWVLSPAGQELDLPVAFAGERWTIHRVL